MLLEMHSFTDLVSTMVRIALSVFFNPHQPRGWSSKSPQLTLLLVTHTTIQHLELPVQLTLLLETHSIAFLDGFLNNTVPTALSSTIGRSWSKRIWVITAYSTASSYTKSSSRYIFQPFSKCMKNLTLQYY
jgi:hypothetical protein